MTIAAVATAPAVSAIGVIRISGDRAFEITGKVFAPAFTQKPRRMTLGKLFSRDGQVIDEALVCTYHAPHSYTGEDMCELFCHGSVGVLDGVMKSLIAAGARAAKAGEFTKRAFLNGKLDLTQAEAVADLIDSECEAEAVNAASMLGGSFGEKVKAVRLSVIRMISQLFAEIDFPDEETPELTHREASAATEKALSEISALRSTAERGTLLKEGIPVAIVGCVNAGKSSLLNALAGFERSIVTEIPGTTRDVVEQRIRIGGMIFRIQDTAGLRESRDRVEKIGIERTIEAITSAHIVLAVFDGAQRLTDADRFVIDRTEDKKRICVINKSDLPMQIETGELENRFEHIITVSAGCGEGIEELAQCLGKSFSPEIGNTGLVTKPRHSSLLERAQEALSRARCGLLEGSAADKLLTDLEDAAQALSEITGESASADVVEDIFSRFCVGK